MVISLRSGIGAVLLLLLCVSTWADDYQAGSIHIDPPWSRALPPSSTHGAVYLTVTNHGHQLDRLVEVASPIAQHAEFHTHRLEDGMIKMRQIESLALPPHETVSFVPGGHHIMLIGLKQPLKQGHPFPIVLQFEQAGEITLEVTVQAAGATSASQTGHDHGGSQTHQTGQKHNHTQDSPADSKTPIKRIELVIQHGKVAIKDKTVRVNQGERLELYWSSDKPWALHLHGYDIETEVTPHSPAVIRFTAHASGRFPVERHGGSGHNNLIYLEVHPR